MDAEHEQLAAFRPEGHVATNNAIPRRNTPEWRDKNNARRRELYAQSPTVRAKAVAASKVQQAKEGPEYRREMRLKRLYGITSAQYERMFEHQGGVCAVCGRPPHKVPLNVDHDHKTGLVRGLLCWYCNQRVVGGARDSVELLRAAVEYLDHPPACRSIGPVYGRTGRVTKKRRRKKSTKEKS